MLLRSKIAMLLLAVLTACTQAAPMDATLSSSGYTTEDVN
jgi:hypothetical protein